MCACVLISVTVKVLVLLVGGWLIMMIKYYLIKKPSKGEPYIGQRGEHVTNKELFCTLEIH